MGCAPKGACPQHGAASICQALLCFPRRCYPPNKWGQSLSLTPSPDGNARLCAPGPGSRRCRASAGLGALAPLPPLGAPGSCPGLPGAGVSQLWLCWPGPGWQVALCTDTPGESSPQALVGTQAPPLTQGASVLTLTAQHCGLLPAGIHRGRKVPGRSQGTEGRHGRIRTRTPVAMGLLWAWASPQPWGTPCC